jgi:hypothetical protein
MKNNKINVYLISRISKDAHHWNNLITSFLDKEKFDVFLPQENNPWNKKHKKFPQKIVDIDVKAINVSHIGLALPEFGKDCAWECGYYANSDKILIFFVDNQLEWLRDWMIKGSIDYLITNNLKTYQLFKKDPILNHKKIILIKEISNLSEAIISIYKKHYVI